VAFRLDNTNAFFSSFLPMTGYPFSMTAWFRVSDSTSFTALMGFLNVSTGARCDIYYAGDGAKQAVAKTVNGSAGSAYSTSPMVPGQWHHLTAVFSSSSDRKIYLDGGNVGVNNDSISVGVLDTFYFGNGYSADATDVAEISLVGAAVSAEEAAVLAQGYPVLALPYLHQLVTYHDCIRDAMRPKLGPDFLSVGVPTVVDHPRVMFPNGGRSIQLPARVRGPFRVEEMHYRSLSSEQSQHSSAGVASTSSILSGEVLS